MLTDIVIRLERIEEKIDEYAYQLYSLTKDEIKIVESETGR